MIPLVGLAMAGKTPGSSTPGGAAAVQLPPLPYSQEALEPYMSAQTMSFRYGKHHQIYVDNLNKLITGSL